MADVFTCTERLLGRTEATTAVSADAGTPANPTLEMSAVKTMAENPTIFAMANPDPEIRPDVAKEAGTKIVFDAADPFAVQRSSGEFGRLIEKHFDIVFANAEEARLMFGNNDLEKCAGHL